MDGNPDVHRAREKAHPGPFALRPIDLCPSGAGVGAGLRSLIRKIPRRMVALTTIVMAGILCALWIGQSAAYAITGQLPQMLRDIGTSTHLVAALDLSLLVPVYLLGAALLWRQQAWGYVISDGTSVQGGLVTTALAVTSPVQAAAGIKGAWTMLPLWMLMGSSFVCAAVVLFRSHSSPNLQVTRDLLPVGQHPAAMSVRQA